MKLSNLLLAALTAAAGLAPAAAQARPAVKIAHPAPERRLQWDSRKFMRVSEVRPGMRGYALTVFRGTKIERFGIEVLGVLAKYNQGKDYILFRATDGPPVTRHLNIAHGMSGSPIYINGRLVGAISMEIPSVVQNSPSFPKEPIGLATPIEAMFDAWSPDLPAHPGPVRATASTGDALAGLPLSAGGFSRTGLAKLGADLAPLGLQVAAGGGGGAAARNPLAQGAQLVPGAAVGVSLMQGDMDVTATGTVTYRDGNRVLLFGHPFFNLGPIDAPMTTAYVVSIYPSYQDSVKLGAPIETVGRVFQDRPFSLGGQIGPKPQMIPVTVSVDDRSIRRRKAFHVRVIDHPLLTARLISRAASDAIDQVHGLPGDSVARVTLDAEIEEIGRVHRTNTFYDALSISDAATADLNDLLRLLQSNPFYPLAVKRLQMTVTIENRHDTAEIDHIFVTKSTYEPGETVPVGVVLHPFKRDSVTRTIPVKIPANTPDGPLTLTVLGGGEGNGGGISLGGGLILTRPSSSQTPPGTVRQLVKQYEERPQNDQILARLTLPGSALSISGERLPDLPPTLSGVLRSTRSTGLHTERNRVETVRTSPYIVSGSESLTITVAKNDLSETPSAPPPPAADAPDTDKPADDDPPAPASPAPANAAAVSDWASAPPILITTAPKPRGSAGERTADETPAANASQPTRPQPDETPAAGPKPVGRLAKVWRQEGYSAFAAGTPQGAAITSAGDVRLAPPLRRIGQTGETYVWSVQPDGHGGLYLGTGDRGIIFQQRADGRLRPFYHTGELEVTSLALDAAGNLYAGTAPHGIVFQITPSGQGRKVLTAKEKYITALTPLSDGRLIAATGGGSGRLYVVPTTGPAPASPAPWVTTPETHLLSLAAQGKTVYAGSSPNGVIYRIDADGQSSVLFDAPEANISALAVDSRGRVYAGTFSRLYRIAPDGRAKTLIAKTAGPVLALRCDGSDTVTACAGDTLYRIQADDTVSVLSTNGAANFLTLGLDPAIRTVYAGTAGQGDLWRLGGETSGSLSGSYESPVHDAGVPARWGTITWDADAPKGASVTLQTRTGEVQTPDASWSPWADAPSGQAIASPPGRFVQYRALLTADAATEADAVRLRSVALSGLTRNQPPTVRILSPRPGEAVHGPVTLRWRAGDPDGDALTYDLELSRDGGQTWTPLRQPNGPPPAPAAPSESDVSRRIAQMETDLKKRSDIPAAIKAKMMADAPGLVRQSMTPHPAAHADGPLRAPSYTWNTTTLPDGRYRYRVTASDRASSPDDPQTAQASSGEFAIVNTSPSLITGRPVVHPDRAVTLQGTAGGHGTAIRAVQFQVDGGMFTAVSAADGLFDSPREAFEVRTPILSSGPHALTLEAFDAAGNTTKQIIPLVVP